MRCRTTIRLSSITRPAGPFRLSALEVRPLPSEYQPATMPGAKLGGGRLFDFRREKRPASGAPSGRAVMKGVG
jgi:hypothetical protein